MLRAMRRWSGGDLEGTMELFAEDIVWEPSFPGFRSRYDGHAGVRAFWAAFLDAWEHITMDAEETIELDAERLLTVTRFRAKGAASGVEVDGLVAQIWTVGGGLISRYQSFGTRQEALAAAGAGVRG